MTASAKRKSSAHLYYYICSYEILCGECWSKAYETRQAAKPFTLRDYARELHEFCDSSATAREREEWLDEHEPHFSDIELWPYDDRIYRRPLVQEITKSEYDVLWRYLL